MRISGLDKLQKNLKELEKILSTLDGEICTIQFNANDPSSIEGAIKDVVRMIDNRIGQYGSNSFAASLIEQTKEAYRKAIIKKAAAVRLEGKSNE